MQTSPKLLLESSFRDVFLYKKSPSFNGEIGGRLFQIIFVVFIIIVIIVTVVAFCEKYFNQSFAEHPYVDNPEHHGQRTKKVKKIIPVKLVDGNHDILTIDVQKSNRNGRDDKRNDICCCPYFQLNVFSDENSHQDIH